MLIRLALALICSASIASSETRLTYLGRVSVSDAGGLSGLELAQDGRTGITVSDRGDLFAVALERTDGKLSKVTLTPWPTRPEIQGDVEGIATSDNETYHFSLEGPAKVMTLSKKGAIKNLPRHPNFAEMGSNRSLEALAIDRDGALYTLPEKGQQLYAYKDGEWQLAAKIPQRGSFLSVGADFGPDNLFYLLERTVTPLGFRTRIRRFDLSAADLAEETLLTTWPSYHDNLEGISLWVDADGNTRITMISDDNFLRIQRSEIVEYVLQE